MSDKYTEWQKREEARKQAEKERRDEVKAKIIKTMLENNIDQIIGTYEGSGDSCNAEGFQCRRVKPGFDTDIVSSDTDDFDVVDYPGDCDELYGFIWDCAYGTHPGFENNEGGHGEVIILSSGRIVVRHWDYIIEEVERGEVEL